MKLESFAKHCRMVRKSGGSVGDVGTNKAEVGSVDIQRLLDRYVEEVLGERREPSPRRSHEEICAEQKDEYEGSKNSGVTPQEKKPEIVVFHRGRKGKQRDRPRPAIAEHLDSDTSHSAHSYAKLDVGSGRLNSKEVLKKIQFDVGSFGMKSLSKEKQREQERQRAITLGAKPTKNNKSMNYRQYIEDRKRLQNDAQSEGSLQPMQKKSKKSKPTLSQPKFWKEGNKSLLPQVGKYRNGVLKLSSKDIKSIKGRK